MSYCTRCGSYIPQGETACPACGYDPEAEKAEQQQTQFTGGAAQAAQAAPQSQQGEYHSQQGSYQAQTEEKPQSQAMTWAPWNQEEEKQEGSYGSAQEQTGSAVSEELRRLSVLSYIGPFFLLPLFLHKDNEFIRYHANQGLCLFIFEVITNMLFGGILHLASLLFSIYCVVLGAKAAASGKTLELPLVGKWRILKGKY